MHVPSGKALLASHEQKLEKRRENLRRTHAFETDRFNSNLKAMDWRAKRYFEDQQSNFSRTTTFNQRDIDHARCMETHKVTASTLTPSSSPSWAHPHLRSQGQGEHQKCRSAIPPSDQSEDQHFVPRLATAGEYLW